MIEATIDDFKKLAWFPFSDEPIVKGKFYLPQLSNPQVLLPEESCDGKWHLFVHSWLGVHHFVSDSGIAWEPKNLFEVRAHSPFIYRENENYYPCMKNIIEKFLLLVCSIATEKMRKILQPVL